MRHPLASVPICEANLCTNAPFHAMIMVAKSEAFYSSSGGGGGTSGSVCGLSVLCAGASLILNMASFVKVFS